ncbi:DUF6444 domain-containing protein [Corallococcus macrosporus]|uniref:Transposase n=1 Tax=Corallococcus macrosporus DSM 14697 TaxID=1189310 RepID=A0A250K505_9BACT|nr:transposase [Corallococcus macrosporus DSM 14697]
MAGPDAKDVRIAQLEAAVAERDTLIEQLRAEFAALRAEVAELKSRLNANSTNSSKPPSSDGPGVKRKAREGKGRKRGGQPGHKGTQRELLPTETCNKVVPVTPGPCAGCSGPVRVKPGASPGLRHQVWEVPEVAEYQLHAGCCGGCGQWHVAKLPAGVPRRCNRTNSCSRSISTLRLLTPLPFPREASVACRRDARRTGLAEPVRTGLAELTPTGFAELRRTCYAELAS